MGSVRPVRTPASARHVWVLTRAYPAPTETFVSNEVESLRELGHNVTVLVLDRLDDDPRTRAFSPPVPALRLLLAHVLVALRHPVRYAQYTALWWRSGHSPGGGWRRLPWWAREIERASADVLHAQFAWTSALQAWALSILTGVPWVVTAHANDIFATPQMLLEKLWAADAAITVCEYNRRELVALGVRRPIDIVVCGVLDAPARAEGAPVEWDVCLVGRLVPKKGTDLLVRAVAELAAEGTTIRAVVIGEGQELPALQELARTLGVADSVTFLGGRPHDEVLATMTRATLFCLPCRVAPDGDRDSMPVVIKEAMVRGIPVVATDAVAVPEMVSDQTGWLVPPEDVTALAHALRDALADPDARRARGAAGRARVHADLLVGAQTERLLAIYERVIRESSR